MQPIHEARLTYYPALDGLRAFAVVAVLLYHGGVSWMSGGFLGVDVFFVLSGFLITSLLLSEWQQRRTIALGQFWARRARRLLPALFLVLAAVAAYAAWLAPSDQLGSLRADSFATLAYGANWRFITSGQGYFAQFAAPSPLRHAWSLAIEEQFYLLWPLIVFAWLRVRRGSTSGLFATCIAAAAASAAAMAVLFTNGSGASRVYYGTDTRAQAILIGAALAVLVSRRAVGGAHPAGAWLDVLGLAGAAVVAAAFVGVSDRDTWMYRGGYALVAVASACVVAAAVRRVRGPLAHVLSWSPARWIGRISYGLYLWHWPVYVVLIPDRVGLDGDTLLALRVAVTFALATASYYLVERPIRTMTWSVRRAWAALPAGALALVAVLLVATAGGHPAVAIPTASGRAGVPATAAVPIPGVVPQRVLIVGDSVALTLGVGLSDEAPTRGVTVFNQGILGCGLVSGGYLQYHGEVRPISDKCAQWPQRWGGAVAQFDPDLALVLVGSLDGYDHQVDGRWLRVGTPAWVKSWRSDLESAVDVLSSRGARVVFLTVPYYQYRYSVNTPPDMEHSVFNPSRVDEMNDVLRSVAATDPRTAVEDLNAFLSPDGQIHETVDGQVVQGDGVHFTRWGADYVARWLLPALSKLTRVGSVTAPTPTTQ